MRIKRDVEDILRDLGSIEDILERHGYSVRRGRTNCPDPTHEDKNPSAKILPETAQGRERLYCHSCGLNADAIEVARLLGQHIEFTVEVDTKGKAKSILTRKINWRPPRTWKQIQRQTILTREFADDPTVEKDWLAAKLLARLGNRQSVQREILRNYDYFTDNFNLPRVWRLVEGIWDYGVKVFGLPKKPHDPKYWKAWVSKVAKDLES